MESDAAQVSRLPGIAIECWPTAQKDGQTVAEYYRIVRDTSYSLWPEPDVRCLTIALDGQICLEGEASNADHAALCICRIADNNLDTAKGVFDSVLRVKPIAIA
jgi:hypothetical protein